MNFTCSYDDVNCLIISYRSAFAFLLAILLTVFFIVPTSSFEVNSFSYSLVLFIIHLAEYLHLVVENLNLASLCLLIACNLGDSCHSTIRGIANFD